MALFFYIVNSIVTVLYSIIYILYSNSTSNKCDAVFNSEKQKIHYFALGNAYEVWLLNDKTAAVIYNKYQIYVHIPLICSLSTTLLRSERQSSAEVLCLLVVSEAPSFPLLLKCRTLLF